MNKEEMEKSTVAPSGTGPMERNENPEIVSGASGVTLEDTLEFLDYKGFNEPPKKGRKNQSLARRPIGPGAEKSHRQRLSKWASQEAELLIRDIYAALVTSNNAAAQRAEYYALLRKTGLIWIAVAFVGGYLLGAWI